MKTTVTKLIAASMLATGLANRAFASSHMDAPLITRDPAANTTDVYAFVSVENGQKYLVVALGVYPHEEPGIGPNAYNFDDNVLYQIHVATGRDLAAGRASISYQFKFDTTYKNVKTILVSYLGVTGADIPIKDPGQNLVQRYTVTKLDWHSRTVLGSGFVPPNNQGNATPRYNQVDNGENPAKDGVSNPADLDFYTQQAITPLKRGYLAFAGQRDDGFFADVQAVFDLLSLRSPGKDSQGGFNLHMIALRIPIAELGGDQQIAGVYATTSRPKVSVLRDDDRDRRGNDNRSNSWVQVGRQGNPLFNEALVAVVDKDLYSRTSPSDDAKLFSKYALKPELARLLNLLVFEPDIPGIETDRTDIAAIYIPDMIKVDLSTGPARLAGSGFPHPTNPDDDGFSRLSIFDTPPMCFPARSPVRSTSTESSPVAGPTGGALATMCLTSPLPRSSAICACRPQSFADPQATISIKTISATTRPSLTKARHKTGATTHIPKHGPERISSSNSQDNASEQSRCAGKIICAGGDAG